MSIHTPAWVRDAVFYQIFPDRFASSAAVPKPGNLEPWAAPPTTYGFKGGDLLGVTEHLDYLVDLGITAIYFTPVFASTANHRYHTYDYMQVDPLLGGNPAFRTMLDACHARNIRVVLDGVFNHASRGFYQFNHTLENGPASPYVDWFHFTQFPANAYDEHRPPGYQAWWGLHGLPKFNIGNPAVREFLLGVGEYWVREGIDGWRLDVPGEIADDSFWQEFRARVKGANPEAYIVGEIWGDARHWLQGDEFDAVMNYLFAERTIAFTVGSHLERALVRNQGWDPTHPLDGSDFAASIEYLLHLYPREVTEVQLNLLDSHDTARFLTMARGDVTALKLATLFQMTYPGAPSIYYGDEIGLEGRRDPDSRRAFPWDPQAVEPGPAAVLSRGDCAAPRPRGPAHGQLRVALRNGRGLRVRARVGRRVPGGPLEYGAGAAPCSSAAGGPPAGPGCLAGAAGRGERDRDRRGPGGGAAGAERAGARGAAPARGRLTTEGGAVIRGLIFDFDGLIIDTEGPAFQAWQEIFTAHGHTLTLDTWSDYVGAATGSFPAFERLEAELGRPVDRESLLQVRQARKAALAAALPLLPGVAAWIAEGRALGLRLAIASSGPCVWVQEHLARLGLAGAFDCIRCADDVAAAKPAPDLYLAVLDALELAPDEVLALEDSPNGD